MAVAYTYTVMMVLLALFTAFIAVKAILRKDHMSILIGIGCILVFFMTACYLASILVDWERAAKITSSLYFLGVSVILIIFLRVNMLFTNRRDNLFRRIAYGTISAYAVFEIIMFFINMKTGVAVDLVPAAAGDPTPPYFVYVHHPLFYCHLIYSYIVIGIILYQLVAAALKTPYGYRSPYVIVIVVLSLVIIVNAIFLFIPADIPIARFDMSLPGYYVLALFIYWTKYYYSQSGMLLRFKEFIVDNIEEGVVLFDYENKLIMANDNANKMLINIDLSRKPNLNTFVQTLGLSISSDYKNKPETVQITLKTEEQNKTLRCSIRSIYNKRKESIGYLFSFQNTEFENDILTGFQSYNALVNMAEEEGNFFTSDMVLSIIDINNLGLINASQGHNIGDEALQALAKTMRAYFPKNSYFARSKEASLAVFTSTISEQDAAKICRRIKKDFKYSVQYAVGTIKEEDNLLDGINIVDESLNTRKVMDNESMRSNSLSSLIKALQEVDNDTRAHVKRTEYLARKLGEKLGLSQLDQTNLSLLSVLHDIGKIAIPLEILNKPEKLNDEEWEVMKTHTVKGYNIAMSSPFLRCIADEILHHHERWDGRGYPDGLSKETIPLLSRIVSVVDSYDAMITDRPYRKGMSISRAIEEIKACSGKQFDPRVASEFIKIIEAKPHIDEKKLPVNTVVDKKNEELEKIEESTATVYKVPYSRYMLTSEEEVWSADDNFTELTGYTQEDIDKGINQIDFIPQEDRLSYQANVNEQINKNGVCFLEHRFLRKDGSIIYVFCYGRRFYDSAVRDYRNEITIFDAGTSHSVRQYTKDQEDKAEKRLERWEKIYRTDSLTGLLSHAAFENDATQKIISKKHKLAFVMIDIDYFKQFNDTYGHHEGDKYLIYTANALMAAVKEDDLVCRMGGDEFSLLLQYELGTDDNVIISDVKSIYEKVDLSLKTSFKGATSLSMGIAICNNDLDSFAKLYEESDKALYQVKKDGRGSYGAYRPKL